MLTWRKAVWGILLVTFFISTALALRLSPEFIFVSPDENAAFTFSQLLADHGTIRFSEPLNTVLGGLVHPRSTVPFAKEILPGSFLGLVLLTAGVGAVLGPWGALLVTPVLAVLAVLAWRATIARLFKHELLGDLAGFFLMIHPAFWYYTGRVMMHNVAFIAFLIFGGWLMVTRPIKHREINFFLAGLSLGLALLIRVAEAPWVVGGLALLFIIYRRVLGWRAIMATIGGLAIMLAVQLGLNATLYGSPLMNGYTAHYDYGSVVAVDQAASVPQERGFVGYILPFGFAERVILQNVWGYGFWLYPVFSSLALLGMVLVAWKKTPQRKTWQAWLVGTLILAGWLTLVYGSWKIADNPDPFAVTLGNSHVRYWLPLFALASVFCARVMTEIWNRTRVVAAVLMLLALGSATWLVFWSEDGFLHSRAALKTFVVKKETVLALTEPEAIIIADRADKYLFPERRVITPLRDERTYAVMPKAVEQVPLYYFGITFPESDLEYLNTLKLPPLGVKIELVTTIQEESLYRISAR